MRIDILTLFPGMFDGPMTESMLWKARDRGLLDLRLHDIRTFTRDKHRKVDDVPYGGGGGMVLRVDVVVEAVETVVEVAAASDADLPSPPVILMTPQGRPFSHTIATALARLPRLILLCGHYEGIDERVRDLVVTDEISIGDYVLTGGELAAMVIVDAVVRHIPGVLGAEGAADRDSHADGILEGPHYTRPPVYRGLEVPETLLAGNHHQIVSWRRKQGLRRTWQQRPDLLMRPTLRLTDEERMWLAEFADADSHQFADADSHRFADENAHG